MNDDNVFTQIEKRKKNKVKQIVNLFSQVDYTLVQLSLLVLYCAAPIREYKLLAKFP